MFCRKEVFYALHLAEREAARVTRQTGRHASAYRCDRRGLFHLTSQPFVPVPIVTLRARIEMRRFRREQIEARRAAQRAKRKRLDAMAGFRLALAMAKQSLNQESVA